MSAWHWWCRFKRQHGILLRSLLSILLGLQDLHVQLVFKRTPQRRFSGLLMVSSWPSVKRSALNDMHLMHLSLFYCESLTLLRQWF
jgi:hypothetical protein